MRIGVDASPLTRNRAGIGTYVAHLLTALVRIAPDQEFFLYSPHLLPEKERAFFGAQPHVRIVRCPSAADGPPGLLGSGGSLSWHELQAAGQGPAWRDRDDPRSCDGSPRATFSKIVRAAAFIPTNETDGAPGFPRGHRFRPF